VRQFECIDLLARLWRIRCISNIRGSRIMRGNKDIKVIRGIRDIRVIMEFSNIRFIGEIRMFGMSGL
jgi:hypothetical protein